VSVTSSIRSRQRGFTLAEVAIVFLIVALLIGGTVLTFSAQNDARQIADTQRTLEQARDAILGFAIRAERLPCPAAGGAATGVEAFVSATDLSCLVPINGFVPALTLGIGPTDGQGYLIDSWGNRIRYSVSQWVSNPPANVANCPPIPPNLGPLDYTKCPAFTTAGSMKGLGVAAIPANAATMLRVCNAAACGVPPPPNAQLTFFAPAVLYSTGKNAAGVGTDEQENANLDTIFVSRTPTPFEAAPLAGFDDLVIWLSPNILYHRLIAAGAL
jgi:type II secretory pathway pseudopilin PulG